MRATADVPRWQATTGVDEQEKARLEDQNAYLLDKSAANGNSATSPVEGGSEKGYAEFEVSGPRGSNQNGFVFHPQ